MTSETTQQVGQHAVVISPERRARMRRRKIRRGVLTVMLSIGLGIMFYPAINRAAFLYHSVQTANEYEQALMQVPNDTVEMEWRMARAYNEARTYNEFHDENAIIDPFSDDAETQKLNEEYAKLLNVFGNGVMGYIDIPKINQRLNIFHGTDERALMQGVGHVQGTSLPVGGESSHCVLSAHRGLPTAKLFTDLDQLKVGDQFYLHVLGHHMAYEVDDIRVVSPSEISSLNITQGNDEVTLITCTPYAVNTHRLLVRGHSVPYVEEESPIISVLSWLTPARLAVLVLVLLALVVGVLVYRKKRAAKPTGRHARG